MNKQMLIGCVVALCMVYAGSNAFPTPVLGTYYPAPGAASTWQTYWDDGTFYGTGPLEVGNVIMGWNSIFPTSLWDLCPNTLVNSPNLATDLIIESVTPEPPGSGIVSYDVIYAGGELRLDGALWGGSGKYMVDLDGASAFATIDWTGGVPESGCDYDGASCAMLIEATGTFVDYPGMTAIFSATFNSDYICSGGFSGSPSDVEITIIPEPSTIILMLGSVSGLAAIAGIVRRRKH